MKKRELHDQLLLVLMKRELNDNDKNKVLSLISDLSLNWELFLGKVLFNRVNGIVYRNLSLFEKVPREVLTSLELNYEAQKERVIAHSRIIGRISELFMKNQVKHAFLKGSVLNTVVYPVGERISNDTDVLISTKDINKVTEILLKEGFVQGYYDKDTNQIVEASKEKKIFIRSTTHELCTFVKLEENRFYKVNGVDVNIKLSATDSIETTEYMLNHVITVENNGIKIATLDWNCLFVQLASHLYREARLATKIISGTDLQMYKFYDFYALMNNPVVELDWDEIYEICVKNHQLKCVFYAMCGVNILFDNIIDEGIMEKFKPENVEYIDQYVGKAGEQELYHWEKSFEDRMFDYSRKIEAGKNIFEDARGFSAGLSKL